MTPSWFASQRKSQVPVTILIMFITLYVVFHALAGHDLNIFDDHMIIYCDTDILHHETLFVFSGLDLHPAPWKVGLCWDNYS